ncbi:hypothetical protein QTN25_002460 [Entamoeba marina]
MLDTYVPYKSKNIKGRKPKKQLQYSGYYEDDEDFDNKNNILTFNSVAEFQKYYDKHKTEIDAMKTRGINAKYKIDGYKLSRKNNVLQFYLLNTVNNTAENDDIQKSLDEIKHMLNHIMKNMVFKSDSKQFPSTAAVFTQFILKLHIDYHYHKSIFDTLVI